MTATTAREALTARSSRRTRARAGTAFAATALAAGVTAWAALPVSTGRAGTRPVLALACTSAVLTVAQLVAVLAAARTEVMPRPDAALHQSPLAGAVRRTAATALTLPWPQALIVAALALEALHPARPWHTAILGAVLLAFLLTLHLAGTGDGPGVLRPHWALIAAGLGLTALSAGTALLPEAGPGWLAIVAAIAALLTAGLALPL